MKKCFLSGILSEKKSEFNGNNEGKEGKKTGEGSGKKEGGKKKPGSSFCTNLVE